MCLAVCGCASFKKDDRVQVIDKFSDQLAALIKIKDAAGYADCFPREGDHVLNTQTGRASELPINDEMLAINRTEVMKNFDLSVGKIEKLTGCSASEIQLLEVQYLIDELPVFKRNGILKFDVTLEFVKGKKTVEVWLQGCLLGTRGVLIVNDLLVNAK
jgi:hypothetical protein